MMNTTSAKYCDDIAIQKKTILLVEDEEMLLGVVKLYLEEAGFTVITGSTGEEAEELYGQHPEIALVLSDIGLPGITGDELFFKLREKDPAANIILSSGFIDAGTKSKLLDAGVNQIVEKPYVPGELLKQIRAAIAG